MNEGVRYVLPERYADLSGYSIKAIERKIESGVWLDRHEYIVAPDGRRLIDIIGVNKWAEGQRRAG